MLKSILSLLSFIIGISCMAQINNDLVGQGPDSGRHVNNRVTNVTTISNTDNHEVQTTTPASSSTESSRYSSIDSNKVAVINFHTYPNPSNGIFKIKFDVLVPGTFRLVIRNSLGVIIYQELIYLEGNTIRQFDFQSYEKGLYFISIENSQGSSTKRMILK